MRGVPLPILRENCQNWVWKVMQDDVDKDILTRFVPDVLKTIPIVGEGVPSGGLQTKVRPCDKLRRM
jgi:hypothetical protein